MVSCLSSSFVDEILTEKVRHSLGSFRHRKVCGFRTVYLIKVSHRVWHIQPQEMQSSFRTTSGTGWYIRNVRRRPRKYICKNGGSLESPTERWNICREQIVPWNVCLPQNKVVHILLDFYKHLWGIGRKRYIKEFRNGRVSSGTRGYVHFSQAFEGAQIRRRPTEGKCTAY